jgi:hypothetical protein
MVFKMRTGPLPNNHPLKNGLVVFGAKRPNSSAKPSAPAEQKPAPTPKEK